MASAKGLPVLPAANGFPDTWLTAPQSLIEVIIGTGDSAVGRPGRDLDAAD